MSCLGLQFSSTFVCYTYLSYCRVLLSWKYIVLHFLFLFIPLSYFIFILFITNATPEQHPQFCCIVDNRGFESSIFELCQKVNLTQHPLGLIEIFFVVFERQLKEETKTRIIDDSLNSSFSFTLYQHQLNCECCCPSNIPVNNIQHFEEVNCM